MKSVDNIVPRDRVSTAMDLTHSYALATLAALSRVDDRDSPIGYIRPRDSIASEDLTRYERRCNI
jgi:hypothetical protein